MSNDTIVAGSRGTVLEHAAPARPAPSPRAPQELPSPDARFKAGAGALVAVWEARLRAEGSALVDDTRVWESTLMRASAVLAECAVHLAGGEWPSGAAGWLCLTRPDLGALCAAQGIGLSDVLRADAVFTELTTRHLHDCVADAPDGLRLMSAAILALHRAVAAGSQETVRGYDRYLTDRIEGARAGARRGMSREVHDHVGNGVSLAYRHLEIYDALRGRDDPAADRRVAQARRALTEAMENIRLLASGLRPRQACPGVVAALRRYVASADVPGTEVGLRIDGDERWIPDDVADELFTVVRETLRNAFAHAGATHVTVRIVVRPGEARFSVRDDGSGFDTGARHAGHGLASMAERVDALGGTFDLWSRPGMGTRVQARVPIREERDERAG